MDTERRFTEGLEGKFNSKKRKFPEGLGRMFNPNKKLVETPKEAEKLPEYFPNLAKAIMSTYSNVFASLARWEGESDKNLTHKIEIKKHAGRRSR